MNDVLGPRRLDGSPIRLRGRPAALPEELYSEEGQRLARAVAELEVEARVCALAAGLITVADLEREPEAQLPAPVPLPRSEERSDPGSVASPTVASDRGAPRAAEPADDPPQLAAVVEEEPMSQTNGATPLLLEWQGERRTAYAWSRDPRVAKLGLTGTGIAFRIKRGWTDEEALTTPKGETPARLTTEQTITHDGRTLTIAAWGAELGLRPKTIRERMRRHPDAGPGAWFDRVLSPTEAGLRGGRPRSDGTPARPRPAMPATPPQDARERLRTAETIPAPSEPASGPQAAATTPLDAIAAWWTRQQDAAPRALRVLEQVGLQVERLLDAPRGPVVLVVDGGSGIDAAPLLAGIGCDFEEV